MPAVAKEAAKGPHPSIGATLSRVGSVIGAPFGTVGRELGTWFRSTFLTEKEAAAEEHEPVITGEIPWKRTATSRTLRNENGSYTAEAFTLPINYKNTDGVWQPIDNTLVSSTRPDYAWQNKANAFKVRLKDHAARDLVGLDVAGDTYTFGPVAAEDKAGTVSANRANYRGLYRGTDLAYDVLETGLKETLTLHNSEAPNVFKFALSGPIGAVNPRADGSLAVKDRQSNLVMTFDAPWAIEQPKGNVVPPILASDRHSTLSAEEVLGGFEITLTVDRSWLETAVFPVIVDPSVTIQPAQAQARETYVLSSCTSACSGTTPGTWLLVGTDASVKSRR